MTGVQTCALPIYLIFKSNQGTGDHLQNELDASSLRPYSSGTIMGKIFDEPRIERGGHVRFSILKNNIKIICFVYKPTGITSNAIQLIKGDLVKVGGGIRKSSPKHGRTLNVEFFEVLKLEKKFIMTNPTCQNCNKKMKSKGKNQGFECVRCGRAAAKKITQTIPRNIKDRKSTRLNSSHMSESRMPSSA